MLVAARRAYRGVAALAASALMLTALSVTPAQAQGSCQGSRGRRVVSQPVYNSYDAYAQPVYNNGYRRPARKTYRQPAYYGNTFPTNNNYYGYSDPYFNDFPERRSSKGKNVAIVAGTTGAGAVAGGLMAGKKGAIIGAVVGAATGTAIAVRRSRNNSYDNRFPF